MRGIGRLFTQTVTNKTYLGTGAYGEVFADPVDKACFINDSIKLVRNAQGDEVVSTARLYAPLTDFPADPPVAGQYAPGSEVTVDGLTHRVIAVARKDAAGPASSHHIEVQLT